MTHPRISASSLTVACLLLLAVPAGASDLEAIRESGRLVVLSFPHPQSAFVRARAGDEAMPELGGSDVFEGIDVEIMQAFAKRLGVEMVIRPVTGSGYAALIPDLEAGRGDVIASSFSITEARLARVEFSDPYFTVYPVVVVREGSPIEAFADLRGKSAATVPGSSQEERLLALGIPAERLRHAGSTGESLAAVLAGEADFTLLDSASAKRTLQDSGQPLRIAFRFPEEQHYAFATRPGSDLRQELDLYLRDLRESGALRYVIDKHTKTRSNESLARVASPTVLVGLSGRR